MVEANSPPKKRGRPKKKTEAENKLEQLVAKSADEETLPKKELVKEEALEVDVVDQSEMFYNVLTPKDTPLTDIELQVVTALGEGKSDSDVIELFGLNKKALMLIKRNPSAQKLISEMGNLRIELMKNKSIGIIEKGLDKQNKKIEELLNSDNEADVSLGNAILFGRSSHVEVIEKLEKMKTVVADEKGDDFKDFMAGLLIGSGNG